MALVATKIKSIGTKPIIVTASIVASGSYSTGGDALDLAPLAGLTTRQPDFVQVIGIAGFVYQYDGVAKKLFVYCNTAGGANAALGQHTAAAYDAAVIADTIKVIATWLR